LKRSRATAGSAAARISGLRGLLSPDDEERVQELIRHMGPLPPVADLAMSEALDAVQLDKKVVSGRLHFVLAQGIGATAIVPDVTTDELRAAMAAIGMRA
jgi:3-dehydroquinate synthase